MSYFHDQTALVTGGTQEQTACSTCRCERALYSPEVFAKNFVSACQGAVNDGLS